VLKIKSKMKAGIELGQVVEEDQGSRYTRKGKVGLWPMRAFWTQRAA